MDGAQGKQQAPSKDTSLQRNADKILESIRVQEIEMHWIKPEGQNKNSSVFRSER